MENAHLQVPWWEGRAVEAQEPTVLLFRVVWVHVSGHLVQICPSLASQLGVDARLMRLQALSGDIYQVYSSSHLVRHQETMTLRFVIISLPLPMLDETANRAAIVCDAWIMMIIIISAFGFSSPDGGRRVSCMRGARLQGRGWVKPCQRPRLDRS